MNLSELTRQELVDLIQKASAELSDRMAQPDVERIKHPRAVIVMREPPEDDKDFMLMLKADLQRGSYVRAADRRRAAEIAQAFPEWVEHQKMPKGSGTGEWKRAKEYLSQGRAKER